MPNLFLPLFCTRNSGPSFVRPCHQLLAAQKGRSNKASALLSILLERKLSAIRLPRAGTTLLTDKASQAEAWPGNLRSRLDATASSASSAGLL